MADQFSQFKVGGAPAFELSRSPAAAAVGRMAQQSELFMAHFEYRVQPEPPQQWLPEGREDLQGEVAWQGGILPENKYQGFRNDLMIGSFHPGHRAKWTAHELCHGLVGFAWRPDAPLFFHAQAARLSELLPVALFYFFDEVNLQRCDDHQGGGPLFGHYCSACERAAVQGPAAEHGHRFTSQGKDFVARELAAFHRSIKTGRPIASPWANLDLNSDGLAYAAMQGPRLNSPEFARFIELFFAENQGCHPDLESLEARLLAVMAGICDQQPVLPLQGNRALWMSQDVGWRLLEVRSQCDDEVGSELDRMVEALAANPNETQLAQTLAAYEALNNEYVLQDPETLFSVGYPLPGGWGLSVTQIGAGIASACPRTWQLLQEEDAGEAQALLARFAEEDPWTRTPLGTRFATWMTEQVGGLHAETASLEAALMHAPQPDSVAISLGSSGGRDDSWRVSPDVVLVEATAQALALLGIGADDQTNWLAIRRVVGGEIDILNLSPAMGQQLARLAQNPAPRTQIHIEEDSWLALIEARLVLPTAWSK